jgi:serine phosphatase RsbU (regulator of sigma subunit)
MNIRKFIGLIVCFLLIQSHPVISQNFDKSRGVPFIRNYLPEEYHAHEQNFEMIQADNGIMYFANFAGILEFDGARWNKILSSSGMRIVSLAKNNKGLIFAGGLYDFGYLQTDKRGRTSFISLAKDSMDSKDIGLIFKVICIENLCYFISEKQMFIYDGKETSSIEFENQLTSAHEVNKQIYLFFNPENQKNTYTGLYKYNSGQFEKTNITEDISLIDISFMLPYRKDEILAGSPNQGLFIIDAKGLYEFKAPVNEFLIKNRVNDGVKISESKFAAATSGGTVLFDRDGKIIQIVNVASGMNDESVNSLLLDKASSLWSGTDNGISKAEINWPLSYLNNKTSGLDGKVQDIEAFFDKIFFATDKGLFYLQGSFIRKINKMDLPCYSVYKNGNVLLIATSRGIFILSQDLSVKQISEQFTFYIAGSEKFPDRIYTGHSQKLGIYKSRGNELAPLKTIEKIMGDVIKISEDTEGDIFFEAAPGKIYMYKPETDRLTEIAGESGLLSLNLNKKGENLFVSSEKGLFSIDKSGSTLKPFFLVANDSNSHKIWMHQLYELSENRTIFTNGEQKGLSFLNLEQNNFEINQTPFLPLADYSIKNIWYDKTSSQIWAGGKDGILISDQKELFDYSTKFQTLIRKITLLAKDSVIETDSDNLQRIGYSDNSLVFEFSVPVFPVVGQVKYRYFLEGFDKDSSQWTTDNKKEYTNLPDGPYLFTVEAMNEYGKPAPKAQFRFKILTPVYRQWWAFIIYAAIAIVLGRAFVLWRMRSTRKEKEKLEEIVKERTEEIERSKQKIEEQRDIAYRQKKEILDSISYAQRIQQAVLPSPQYADDILLEHFILYRPRDIVSGDFYWMRKINNYVAVVAADCTGHGVPGAFMSMLGSSFLNEIVTRRSLDNAAQILNRLRNKVKRSLHQEGKEGEQKDGMDIALLIIDNETLELQYAGAYNPLYIIRENKDVNINDESIELDNRFEFIQLKADRQPIGIHLNEKDFTNHVFQLQNGDNLYSFSDGYVDQFGGETGEKFKHKRFRDLLLSIQGKPMDEQKQILEHAFVRWKRDLAQIDDVLVMGIKI